MNFEKNKKTLNVKLLDLTFFINNIKVQFFYNIIYLLFFFFVLLSVSGSFFQVNSNFLLFFTFTFFLIFIHYTFSSFNFFSGSSNNFITFYIDELFNYNVIALFFLKQSILNNNLLFFKNIFIYVKSFNILVFFSTIVPIEVNLNIRNFLLSKTNDF